MTKLELCTTFGEIDEKYIMEAHAQRKKPGKIRRKMWRSIAACMCIVALGIVGAGHVLGNKVDTGATSAGEIIAFEKAEMGVGVLVDRNAYVRELDAEVLELLFGDLEVTGFASFDNDTHEFLQFEGKIGGLYGVRIVLALPGQLALDTVVEGEETMAMLGNVPVTAGYSVIKSNGIVVYYMTLHMDHCDLYIENGGKDREVVKGELIEVAEKLAELDVVDLENEYKIN